MTNWQDDLQFVMTQEVLHIAAIFLRIGAAVSVMPGVGSQSVSMRVKLAIAVAFSVVILPAAPLIGSSNSGFAFAGLAVSETLVGLILGIGMRFLIMALQIAGSMAAQATSLSQLLGNSGADPMPAIGQLLVVGGLAIAMQVGLHTHAARFFLLSYDLFPIGHFPTGVDVSRWGVGQVSKIFSLAFTLAAPFVIASVLYNLMLGVINRAMPQLMVAFVGAPVITFGGLFFRFIVSPLILSRWSEAMLGFFARPFGGVP